MKRSNGVTIGCIVVAAGKGSRMGHNINKLYMDIDGIPVLARTLAIFENYDAVDDIIVVINKDDRETFQELVTGFGFSKVKAVVEGGSTRQFSVLNGLCALDSRCDIVLIHDGARPFTDKDTVRNCIKGAQEFGACCAAVPVKDTIKVTDNDCFAIETPDRRQLWAVQTPQAFSYKLILEAHKKAMEEGFKGTDDAMLAERMGVKVKMVMGSYFNIKITTNEDLIFAEAIARSICY